MADVDAVVIGSGAGGLTAAVAMAQAGKRVLVLEQHDVPGGWCHSFRLGGHQFSPGVHYLGELGEGGRLRKIYEGLGMAGDLTFLELNPDGYDHVILGDERFDIPVGRERWEARLVERFPAEREGIARYFDIVSRLSNELNTAMEGNPLTLPFRAPTVTRWGLASTTSLLDACTQDPLLRGILSIQAGDHGLGPDRAPAAVHASVQAHYFEGGWYPKGGGAALPRAMFKALRRHGGQLEVRTRVEQILVENGRAIGVRLADGTEVRAPIVISNADPGITFGRLLPESAQSWWTKRKLAGTRWSISALSLYLAVDADLRGMGMDSGNYWFGRSPDVQSAYDVAERSTLDLEDFPGQFLTVTTLKDPSKGKGTIHTMESFVFVSHDAFQQWAHTRYGERPEDYVAMKAELMAKMLRNVERIVPGIKDRVVFSELGTPLTNEHYLMATRGNLYGTEKSRWQVGPFSWPIRTAVPGLYMVGASTLAHGVMGATMSGVAAAGMALGCRGRDLLRPSQDRLRLLPCDDPTVWPQELRDRVEEAHAAS